jgi:hypothetical protein
MHVFGKERMPVIVIKHTVNRFFHGSPSVKVLHDDLATAIYPLAVRF